MCLLKESRNDDARFRLVQQPRARHDLGDLEAVATTTSRRITSPGLILASFLTVFLSSSTDLIELTLSILHTEHFLLLNLT